MADISMCDDKECPQRLDCYRFKAEPHPYRQSYFIGSPATKDETTGEFLGCKYFWSDY